MRPDAGTVTPGLVAPHIRVLAALLFVIAVVATPARQFWAFGVHAATLLTIAAIVRIPWRPALRRFSIEVPFVAYAVLMPIVGRGDRVDIGPLSLSEAGLLAAWSVVAKATLGVGAAIVLSAATPVPDLLAGLERLRVPRRLVAIAGFMLRYGDLLGADLRRMRIARLARGHDPRWLWQAKAVASSVGLLFVLSYERGERVYLAMVSRGYAGSMPVRRASATATQWVGGLAAPALAAAVAIAAGLR